MAVHRIPVGIVGAGPAGLLLGHLLQRAGIESVTVDIRSERHMIERVRASVLEQTTVDLLCEAGLGGRLAAEGLRHEGLFLAFGGERHRLDLADLTGGRAITVYGQNEIVRDLIAARRAAGGRILFDAELVALANLDTERPCLHVRTADADETFVCDFIAGCDGFHGISRASIPQSALRVYARPSVRGWASWPRRRPLRRSWSTACTTRASRCSACARPASRASTSSARQTSGWTPGPTSGSGASCRPACRCTTAGCRTKAPSCRRASPACAASWSSRCVPAGCSSPAMPRIVRTDGREGLNLAVADVWRPRSRAR